MQGKVTWTLAIACAAAVIGSSLQFGYNTGVINAPQTVRMSIFNPLRDHLIPLYSTPASLANLFCKISIFTNSLSPKFFIKGEIRNRFNLISEESVKILNKTVKT